MIDLERVRKIARRIAQKYQLSVPADLSAVVSDCCIYKELSDTGEVDGYTDLSTIPPTMYINSAVAYSPRVRFTIAHELGHIFIPWHNGSTTHSNPQIKTRSLVDKNELEADTFASEILLPYWWVKEQICKSGEQNLSALIEQLVEKSNTSFLACIRALINAWDDRRVVYFTLPTWEHWRGFMSGNIPMTLYWRLGEDFDLDQTLLYDLCCKRNEHFFFRSYEIVCYKFLNIPTDLLTIYETCDYDLGRLIQYISNGRPLQTVPFLQFIIDKVTDHYILLVKVPEHKIRLLHSDHAKVNYYPVGEDYQYNKDALIRCHRNGIAGELNLEEKGNLLWVKILPVQPPTCTYSDPNQLLAGMIHASYDDDMFTLVWRKINGVFGGSNNIKEKGSTNEFYDLLYNRLQAKELFHPLLDHPQFEEFLLNKILQMMEN